MSQTSPEKQNLSLCLYLYIYRVMRYSMMGIHSEKSVAKRCCHCASIRVHVHKPRWSSLLHTQAIRCRLLLLGHQPVQYVSIQTNM